MNKGFTLIELLAVIVVLGAIAIITTVSTSDTINKSKTKLTEIQIEKIEKAAEVYFLKEGMGEYNSDYEYNNNYNDTKTCVNVSYLIENDYIEENEIKDPKDYNKMLGSVKIIYEYDRYTYNYEQTECSASDFDSELKSVCYPVTEETKTVGNVPQGNYIPGDEYICEVKDNTRYRFFILSTNDSSGNLITSDNNDEEVASVNLIMDRNICDDGTVATLSKPCKLAWYADADDNSYGPVTAMNYLYNATKDWDNVSNIVINYTDEGNTGDYGYGYIKTDDKKTQITKKDETVTAIYENLKARLPYKSEISDYAQTNGYLYNHLHINCYDNADGFNQVACEDAGFIIGVYEEGIENIQDIHGYWTFSSTDHVSFSAWTVDFDGYLDGDSIVDYEHSTGVRPVITLKV